MRMNVFIIFVIAVAICFIFNAWEGWCDSEWDIADFVKSASGWTIFVCIVYFIFMQTWYSPERFARGVSARRNAELPLYHASAQFVKTNLRKKFTKKYPEISAKFQLAFLKNFCYNYYIK